MTCYNILLLFRMCAVKITFASMLCLSESDFKSAFVPPPRLVTPSGITSVPMGMETPDMIELRKKRIEDAMDQGGETPALYTILPEKKAAVGGAMMGSAHVYDTTAVSIRLDGLINHTKDLFRHLQVLTVQQC